MRLVGLGSQALRSLPGSPDWLQESGEGAGWGVRESSANVWGSKFSTKFPELLLSLDL